MKKIVLIIAILFLVVGCTQASNVKITIKDNNNHKTKDIEKAINLVKTKFLTSDFDDCELLSINYINQFTELEKELKEENKAQESIVLTFSFKTGANTKEVFSPNSTYTYSAWLIKKNNKWQLINWGQG